MCGATSPLPQYASMAWYSINKKAQGQLYLLHLKVTHMEDIFIQYYYYYYYYKNNHNHHRSKVKYR